MSLVDAICTNSRRYFAVLAAGGALAVICFFVGFDLVLYDRLIIGFLLMVAGVILVVLLAWLNSRHDRFLDTPIAGRIADCIVQLYGQPAERPYDIEALRLIAQQAISLSVVRVYLVVEPPACPTAAHRFAISFEEFEHLATTEASVYTPGMLIYSSTVPSKEL